MPEEVAIRVENVSKNFILPHEKISSVKGLFTSAAKKRNGKSETQHALKDISFEIKKGEFFAIVGRNGSGKSTLLKILAGIYQPTTGKVSTAGKLVPFIELGVGFNPELTGRENVYLNGAMLGFSEKEVSKMYKDIVEFAELERFMDQKLKNYSSGMQVRLAFSMATRSEADILLIDEVLAVGDADFQRKCFNYFKSLKRNNKTVVFVSHDMDAIREYCDRAMMVKEGELSSIGSTSKVSQEYAKLFIDNKNYEENTKGEDRWGSAEVKTVSAKFDANKETIQIEQIIKNNSIQRKIIVGIKINDTEGRAIAGTNTKIEQMRPINIAQKESIKIIWELPNIFSDGLYTLDTAVASENGIDMLDWWNEAAKLDIKKERRLPYPVDPGIKATIIRA